MPRRWAFALARRRKSRCLAGSFWQREGTGPDAQVPAFQGTEASEGQRGHGSVVTDQIAGFRGKKIVLRSGQELEADILVTATGLDVQALGGMKISVNGNPYAPGRHMLYKGVLMEDLPNFAWIVGYTNASWTLKADLSASYICRLLMHLDAKGLGVAIAHDREGCRLDASIMRNLTSGYIARANDRVPRQGSKAPWRVTNHYPTDRVMLLEDPIDDGLLAFKPLRRFEVPELRARR